MLKTILPVSQTDIYTANSNVSFELSIENQEVIQNSIYLSGDLYLTLSDPLAYTLQVDCLTGIHNFFDNWICSSELKGAMSPCNNYGRYVKHLHISSMSNDEKGINKDGELMFGAHDALRWYKREADHISFAFRPLIPFNRSNANLPYSVYGNLTIQTYLVSVIQALFTNDVTPDVNFTMKNLRLHYLTQPDQHSKAPIMFKTYHSSAPMDITSNKVTISKNIGGMLVNSVQASFIQKAHDKVLTFNSLAFEDIDVQRLQFSYNDIANGYIQYTLDTPEEILYNGIAAFNNNGMQKYTLTADIFNQGVLRVIGIKYPQPLDMSKNKFSTTITNGGANAITPYSCYMFFNGVTSL